MSTSVTSVEQNFVVSVIQMIRQKITSGQIVGDPADSLEVAIQCLETGFNIKESNYSFQPSRPIIDTFAKAEGLSTDEEMPTEPTAEDKATADRLKNEGNELMKSGVHDDAIQKYTDAIKLHKNPVFFCNRAAAYGKIDQHDLAIQDCRTALALDPQYAKAYGRMGLALSAQFRYTEAVDAYRTALELDPANESYKNNLDIAEEKSRQPQQQQATSGAQAANPFAAMMGGGGGAGGFDLSQMLNNPAMVNMATQMMADGNMQQMMGNLMSSMGGQAGGAQGMQGLLQAGQQLAAQMQNTNPELVEQLRRTFPGGPPGGGGEGGDPTDQPPPAPPSGGV